MAEQSKRDIVYFDLETQRTITDVGGNRHFDKLGMSVGVTYSTAAGEYRIYRESDADALVEQLTRADLVVGFNHIGFDYAALQAYTILDLAQATLNLDMQRDIEKRIETRLSLDAIAKSTLGLGKTAEGLQAITWYREGKFREIAEYCAFDVKVTMRVHEFGVKHGFVRYLDKNTQAEREVEVDWA